MPHASFLFRHLETLGEAADPLIAGLVVVEATVIKRMAEAG